MAASKLDIQSWFQHGKKEGATHMIVVVDEYDWEDYPVFVMPGQDARERHDYYNRQPMQRVMEVYNLSMDMSQQLSWHRVFNY